jgi:NADP-dependent 3-hydroxy acid dehydrogenase YdfG
MAGVLDSRVAGARRLKDKVCIVTGAGQRIGRATARRLGEEGGRIVVADRIDESATEAVTELRESGVEATKALVDVGTFAGAQELIGAARAAYGRIDVLVNNVGGTIWIKPYHLYTEDEVKLELERSLYPTLWCCLAALPVMIEQRSGSIVNVGSQSVRGLYRLPYAASKGGIAALTKVLLRHPREHGGAGRDRNHRSRDAAAIDPPGRAGGRGPRAGELSPGNGRRHSHSASAAPARAAGGTGGRHRLPCLRGCELHHRAGHQLQRRAIIVAEGGGRTEHTTPAQLGVAIQPKSKARICGRPAARRDSGLSIL